MVTTSGSHHYVRPHLDYGDALYDQVFNNSFHEKLKSAQCKTCLATKKSFKNLDFNTSKFNMRQKTLSLLYSIEEQIALTFLRFDSCQTNIIINKKYAQHPLSHNILIKTTVF